MKNLFYKIYNCDSYATLYELVHHDPLLSDPANWRPYGDNKNNCGTFENQQAKPEAALVEKLTNSIDAILTKECFIRGIDPKSKSPEVPQTMAEAIERFFNVIKGKWENAVESRRREIASRLQIILTGDKRTPNIAIYDDGEGQTPKDFPTTFLSLHHGNKMDIPFVQGKFNMGSTGAVLFCGGDEKYQLILSRRARKLCPEDEYKYGFTLVRKHPLSPEEELTMKSTWYEYFVINDAIPAFEAEALDLGLDKKKAFVDGTVIKLYSYELSHGCQSDATFDLWRELNTLLYDSSLPILICEQRDFRGNTKTKPMLGNKTRISIDSRDSVYKTLSMDLKIPNFGGQIPIEIYIFKSGVPHKEFIRNRSLIFTLNGQTQGFEGQTFISAELGFRQLKEYMLICVDCTKIKTSVRNEIFMSSRDRMREGKYYTILKEQLIALLKNDDNLKQLNQEYKGKELAESKDDKELIQRLFENLKNNDNIKRLLTNIKGLYSFSSTKRTEQPHESGASKNKVETPVLKRFPSYFKVTNLKEKEGKLYKAIALDSHGTITFETNAEDEFLTRNVEKGELEISILNYSNHGQGGEGDRLPTSPDDKLIISRSGPNAGEIRLSITPTEKAVAGDMFEISAKMISVAGELEVVVFVGIEDKKKKKLEPTKIEETPNLNLPKMIRVFKDKKDDNSPVWADCNPPMTADDVIQLVIDDENISEILINMDSNLLKKQVNKRGVSVEMVGKKYVTSIYSHALILYSTLYGYYNGQNEDLGLKKRELDIIRDDLGKAIATIFQYYGGFLMDIGDMDLTDE